ncbi:DUF6950 family protein [Cupriavidus sp. USMAHM13]|uniref:DUF6950 family protein n=1 Tax=Cupriavidus sp. USMAHM13 TaxID=1389192 RepID=UPI0012EA9E75|nr:hypothetical protein [Cupriavidus sp. USMAHM13]
MKRFNDWPSRLAAFIEARRDRAFARGSSDCCMFVADAVLEMTGVDHAVRWRGAYSSDKSALRLLRDYGGVAGFARLTLGEPVAAMQAGRGDIVLIDAPEGEALALCLGSAIAVQARNGLVFLPMSAAKAAWKI